MCPFLLSIFCIRDFSPLHISNASVCMACVRFHAQIVLSMPLSPELLSPMDERTMQRIWQDAASRGGGAGGASRGGGAGAGGQERRGLGRGAGKGGSPGLGPVQGGDSPNFGPIAGGVNWRGNSGGGGGGLRGSNSDPWSKDKKERSPLIGPSGGSSLTSSLDGAFNLDLPADNGRWSRGLKVRGARVFTF